MIRQAITLLAASLILASLSEGRGDSSFVPDWSKEAIYYQIFPERFCNGDPSNDPEPLEKWDGTPEFSNYFGGDLAGVINHLDYLEALGVNVLYFNPLFESKTNHKYHTIDYFKIDPHFGDETIFRSLLKEAHRRGIRVVIDVVFNHTGTDYFAFRDIVENGSRSQYLKWYNIYSLPVKLPPEKPNYESWWGIGEIPKLMTDNPEVRKYFFEATRYWMGMGIDGWRLDVANEISHDFWIEWRKLVKSENCDAVIIGEIWDDAAPWLQGDQFDAVMNYRFRGACVGFMALENKSSSQFDSVLTAIQMDHPSDVNLAMQNLIGSHDTERFLTLCQNDTTKLKLAVAAQMTYIGAPMIYYGDEIGMTGGRDPDCRKTMRWDSSTWNKDLLNWYKTLIRLRKENELFSRGSARFIQAEADAVSYLREYDNSFAVVILNMGRNEYMFPKSRLPEAVDRWKNALTRETLMNKDMDPMLAIPARSAVILLGKGR